MSTRKWKCHNFDPNTRKRRPGRPHCHDRCPGVHPEEHAWANALVYMPRETPHHRARPNDRQYEHERDKPSQRSASHTGRASSIKGRDPPTAPASTRLSRNDTTSISSESTSRSSWTNQPHATSRIQSTSTANKAVVGSGFPSQNNGDWDNGGWGSPTRDNTGGWLSPIGDHSDTDVGLGSRVNKPITLPPSQPSVAKPKPAPVAAPTGLMPSDKSAAKPALSLPSKPSLSASSNPRPNTSNLTEVTPMAAPRKTSPTSIRAPTPRERSASLAINLPPEFITPSPTPPVPPKPRPPALRLPSRPLHYRRESIQTSTSATETAPPSAISVNSNYSALAVPVVSASPRTVGFPPDSPVSAISASTSGGGLRKVIKPEVVNIHGDAEKVPKEPAEVLWDENIEILCRALTRRREFQAAMEQVKRRDQFYSAISARHSSCTLPLSLNSPNDPLNQQVQETQKRYQDVLTDLSERKTSWWPTPAFVNPPEMLVDLEKKLTELEREIEEVLGVAVWSRAEDLAAAATKDNNMNSGRAEKQLVATSTATPVGLTPANVVLALEDLENRIEEVDGDINVHLESDLRKKVRAHLRKRFPPASRPAVTDTQRLETAMLRAKRAGSRVQGLENRLSGLTVVSNADQIQIVRERIKKRREATQELVKKEQSILEFLSIHNASLDVPEDKLKEILKKLTADNGLISSIAQPYCDRIQARIDSIGAATIPEDNEEGLRKSRRDRASDEMYGLVAGASQMQQQLTMADWVQKNWGHIKRGEPVGMGEQSMAVDVVMG